MSWGLWTDKYYFISRVRHCNTDKANASFNSQKALRKHVVYLCHCKYQSNTVKAWLCNIVLLFPLSISKTQPIDSIRAPQFIPSTCPGECTLLSLMLPAAALCPSGLSATGLSNGPGLSLRQLTLRQRRRGAQGGTQQLSLPFRSFLVASLTQLILPWLSA